MDAIPVWYWMTVIGVVTALVSLILFYMAMLLRESTAVVRDTREIVTTVKDTVQEVNEAIVGPARGVGNFLNSISAFLAGLVNPKKEK
jgi:hypothetical protein